MADDTINIDFKVNDTQLQKAGQDVDKFSKDTTKSMGEAEKAAGGFHSKLGEIGSMATGFIAANVIMSGFQEITGAIGGAFSAAKEWQSIQAQTDAVLKSTGNISGMTAGEIRKVASELSDMSGVEDEAIQKGENMLLTFTNVGKGVFPEATAAILDMNVAFEKSGKAMDISDIAIQVGKALNDPIAGIAALHRVGVSFTDDQKNVIEALVKTGDIAGAQKIILHELNTEFGGSAKAAGETFDGQMNKLHNTINDTARDMVLKAMPALMSMASFMNKVLPLAIDAAGEGLERLGGLLSGPIGAGFDFVKVVIGDVVGGLKSLFIAFDTGKNHLDNMAVATDSLHGPMKLLGEAAFYLGQGISAVGDFVKKSIGPMESLIQNGFGKLLDILPKVLPWIHDFAEQHRLLFTLITPIGSLLILIYDHFDKIKKIASEALGEMAKGFKDAYGSAKNLVVDIDWDSWGSKVTDIFGGLTKSLDGLDMDTVNKAWKDLSKSAGDLAGSLKPVYDLFKHLAEDIFKEMLDAVGPIGEALVPLGKAFVDLGKSLEPLEGLIKPLAIAIGVILFGPSLLFFGLLKLLIPYITDYVVLAIKVFTLEINVLSKAIEIIIPVVKTIADVVGTIAVKAFDLFKKTLDDVQKAIDASKPMWPAISDAVKLMSDAVKLIFDGLALIVTMALRAIKAAFDLEWAIIKGAFDIAMGIFTGDWKKVWDGVKEIFSGFWTAAKTILDIQIEAFKKVFTDIIPDMLKIGKDILKGLYDGLVAAASLISDGISHAWDLALILIGNVADWLVDAGWSLVRGFVKGIRDAFSLVSDALSELTNLIPSWKGPPSKDATLLTENGKIIVSSLIPGFEQARPAVMSSLSQLATEVTNQVSTIASATAQTLSDMATYTANFNITHPGTNFTPAGPAIAPSTNFNPAITPSTNFRPSIVPATNFNPAPVVVGGQVYHPPTSDASGNTWSAAGPNGSRWTDQWGNYSDDGGRTWSNGTRSGGIANRPGGSSQAAVVINVDTINASTAQEAQQAASDLGFAVAARGIA